MALVQIRQIPKGASHSLPEVHINPYQVVAIYDKKGNQFVDIWMTTYTDRKDDKWYTDLTAMGDVAEIAASFTQALPCFLHLTTLDIQAGNQYSIYVNAKHIMNVRSNETGTSLYLRGQYEKDSTLLHVTQEIDEVLTMINEVDIALV